MNRLLKEDLEVYMDNSDILDVEIATYNKKGDHPAFDLGGRPIRFIYKKNFDNLITRIYTYGEHGTPKLVDEIKELLGLKKSSMLSGFDKYTKKLKVIK